MKEIGEFFRENMEGVSTNPAPKVWEKIKTNPDLQHFNGIKIRHRRIKIGSIAAILTVAVVVSSLFYYQSTHPHQPETTITTILVDQDNTTTQSLPIANTEKSKSITPELTVEKEPSTALNTITPAITEPTQTTNPETPTTINNVFPTPPIEHKIAENPQTPILNPNPADKKIEEPEIEKLNSNPKTFEHKNGELDSVLLEEPLQEITDIIVLPNAFTPNGDGLNDFFTILPKEQLTNFECYIYNRQGSIVFQSKSPQQAWDGTIKGAPAAQGDYICLVKFTTKAGKTMKHRGTVLLIR